MSAEFEERTSVVVTMTFRLEGYASDPTRSVQRLPSATASR